MKEREGYIQPPARREGSTGWMGRWARRMVLKVFARLEYGEVTLVDEYGSVRYGRRCEECECAVELRVKRMRFYTDVVFGGSVRAAEGYICGDWETSDLTGLMRIMARNRGALDEMEGGAAVAVSFVRLAGHWLRANTREGSVRNIHAHYDLGNDFFAMFLDELMMYSSAYYPTAESTLEEAQRAKLEMICRKLHLRAEDHVVEIGTGWGGFAVYAAQQYGCRVTTATISEEQYRYAREKVAAAGLDGQVTVLQRDYRDVEGVYTKCVSIEMIEAVGHEHLPEYFGTISRLMAPRGLALIQAIWIDDRRYDKARRHVDYIKKYIFPGSCIPSVHAMVRAAKEASDMRLVDLEDITGHYARTIREWRERFMARRGELQARGYGEEFIRMWEYYFCYCEGGFLERVIGNAQLVFAKPLCREA